MREQPIAELKLNSTPYLKRGVLRVFALAHVNAGWLGSPFLIGALSSICLARTVASLRYFLARHWLDRFCAKGDRSAV